MKKWLDPAIDNRILEIIEECEENTSEMYNEFIRLLGQVEKNYSFVVISELENLFTLKTRMVAEVAYRAGFDDGLYVGKKLNP
ncbi:hypothetical protein HP398_29520 [Brevibacillus sp. HB1.4B]|uniref:hypothetical protein n=1 Tax=Brevibacillus sp. HB1.4B TaxID=2738845 RepID=UPI00156AD892|nr:hypothetical protein [Brevibacillus sp. HB1.4B]NRS20561.1 hypothetical protein [Brevibacillus sp. HB1.4B]